MLSRSQPIHQINNPVHPAAIQNGKQQRITQTAAPVALALDAVAEHQVQGPEKAPVQQARKAQPFQPHRQQGV